MKPEKGTNVRNMPKKKRTVWFASMLTGVALLMLLLLPSILPSQAQILNTTLQTALELNTALMNLLPPPLIDPTTDPPGHFSNVIPSQFDPAKTNLVQATWLSGIGCPANAMIANPNSDFTGVAGTGPFTDTTCAIGDTNDQRNQGLLLVKTGPTSNFASATAELINVKGITLTELGYDIRKSGLDSTSPLGSHCGAGAPRFDVVTSDGTTHFLGCNSPVSVTQTPSATGWIRLRWGATEFAAAFPPILPADVISRIVIIFDEAQDASGGPDQFGAAILDNIDVNGTLVGRGPVNAN
jgi:hypothetical protein